ncbi:hypothetical protein Syun_025602 [Stephania yunnanensis]|uniref:Uncharacterized protein n=1 Tax=Stephania yunnanensis TaxID=152371 RepID=A0AAP0EUW5_9MAGN
MDETGGFLNAKPNALERPERPVGGGGEAERVQLGGGGEAVEAWEKERRWIARMERSWRLGGESPGEAERPVGVGGEAVEAWEKGRRWIAGTVRREELETGGESAREDGASSGG